MDFVFHDTLIFQNASVFPRRPRSRTSQKIHVWPSSSKILFKTRVESLGLPVKFSLPTVDKSPMQIPDKKGNESDLDIVLSFEHQEFYLFVRIKSLSKTVEV